MTDITKCDSCKYAILFDKPEYPIDGFDSDIIGQRTGLSAFFRGKNIFRSKTWRDDGWDYDHKKSEYLIDKFNHKNKVICEALPKKVFENKHKRCSLYKDKNQ